MRIYPNLYLKLMKIGSYFLFVCTSYRVFLSDPCVCPGHCDNNLKPAPWGVCGYLTIMLTIDLVMIF